MAAYTFLLLILIIGERIIKTDESEVRLHGRVGYTGVDILKLKPILLSKTPFKVKDQYIIISCDKNSLK